MRNPLSRRQILRCAAGSLPLAAVSAGAQTVGQPERREPFRIVPPDIPNYGILFVDHQRQGRSGHGGHSIAECKNGDILAFYSNVSGEVVKGHGTAGWSEYRRSADGGKTWSGPVVFDYSKSVWDAGNTHSALVFCVITAPSGALIAIAVRFRGGGWAKHAPPVYLLSYDNGKTWTEPRDVDPSASLQDLAMTFDACLVHEDIIYVVFFGGGGDGGGPYSLYVSTDNGETFHKRSILPFDPRNYYSTASILPDGRMIVYSYPYPRSDRPEDEHYMHYVISGDRGRTWSEVRKAYFAKRIRNPQLSDRIGDFYFIHGRSGSYGTAPGNFVLYYSTDAIHWDEGRFLHKKVYPGGDKYTANEVIGKYDSSVRKKLLIQSSIVYDADTSRVNIHHWWIEDILGA